MKKIFLLLTIYFLLTTSSFSQWWTYGGNTLWPYGNVLVTKGALQVDSVVTYSGNLFLKGPLNSYISINKIGTFSQLYLYSEDYGDEYFGDVSLYMNPEEGLVAISPAGISFNTSSSAVDIQSGSSSISINQASGLNFAGADKFKFNSLPSDSSGLTTGHLYFDPATGVVKRKY